MEADYVGDGGGKDGRRGVEACHMVGVNNKADLFHVLAAGMRHGFV